MTWIKYYQWYFLFHHVSLLTIQYHEWVIYMHFKSFLLPKKLDHWDNYHEPSQRVFFILWRSLLVTATINSVSPISIWKYSFIFWNSPWLYIYTIIKKGNDGWLSIKNGCFKYVFNYEKNTWTQTMNNNSLALQTQFQFSAD